MANQRSKVFNDTAELYDQVRPGYPDELVEAVIRMSGIPEGGDILEIGCGTGQATRSFAKRGYQMTCLEAGDRLAELAAVNFKGNAGVRVVKAHFEEWPLPAQGFDLVLAATSFHHLEPGIRFEKCAQALKPGGGLAIFFNAPGEGDPSFRAGLDSAYRAHAAELASDFKSATLEKRADPSSLNQEAGPCFEPFQVRRFPWQAAYGTEDYLGLLNTYSDHAMLDEKRRQGLHAAIRKVCEDRGGRVPVAYVAVLFIAKRRLG